MWNLLKNRLILHALKNTCFFSKYGWKANSPGCSILVNSGLHKVKSECIFQ
jgi:hypothetical protein